MIASKLKLGDSRDNVVQNYCSPAHRDLDDESTWIYPYEPYGDCDFQGEPAGAALMIGMEEIGQGAHFRKLVDRVVQAGFHIHGSGMGYQRENGIRTNRESNWGTIVLPLGATETDLYTLIDWLSAEPHVYAVRGDRRASDWQ